MSCHQCKKINPFLNGDHSESRILKFWIVFFYTLTQQKGLLLTGFDYCVDNESLETLYWLKWGFVIMIIGYIYSQKCNENAKKKKLIYFELWKLWKHSFVYILKKSYQKSKYNNPVQFGIFLTFLTINIASDLNNKSSFQSV